MISQLTYTRLRKLDALAVLLLLAIGWRYALPLPHVTDIILADETRYAVHGLQVRQYNEWPYRARSYALWYALISLTTQDLMYLYDLNFQILTVIVPLAFYGVLRALGLPSVLAFVGSIVILISDLLFEAWPRVTTFAWLFLLLGYALWLWGRERPWGWWALWIGSLVAVYARPEILLSLGLTIVGTFWALRHRPTLLRSVLTGWLLSTLLFFFFWGSPYEPGRLLVAFGQHYAYRWRDLYGEGDPWRRWPTVMEQAFGGMPTSVRDLFRKRSDLVWQHVYANLIDMPKQFLKLTFSHTPFTKASRAEGFILLAGVAAYGFYAGYRLRHASNLLRRWWSRVWPVFTFIPTGLFSVIFIYPRKHYFFYLIFPFWIGWWTLMAQIHGRSLNRVFNRAWIVFIVFTIAWITVPTAREHKPYWIETRSVVQALRALHEQGIVQRVGVPSPGWYGNLELYLPFDEIEFVDSLEQAQHVVQEGKVDALLLRGRYWHQETSARNFLLSLARQGARIFCTPGGTQVVVILKPIPPKENISMLHPCLDISTP